MEPRWLEWARTLQAVTQTGLTYTQDHFDIERYEAIRALAAEMIAAHTQVEMQAVLPELSTARVTPAQMARLFEHYRHPDWPTDFD
jgi:Hydrolase of X-linked nucleoside diphosphate N terminal